MAVILVIEDDPGMRDMLEGTLAAAGHEVVAASSGRNCVQLCSAHAFGLVITDLIMPEQEGLETIREIRSKFPAMPVIAISGAPEEWKALDIARRLGANETLAKPFSPKEMLAVVDKVLQVTQP